MQHHVHLRHRHISTLIRKMSYKTKQKQPTWRESSCLILITNEPCEARQQPKSACVKLDRNDTLFSYSHFSPGKLLSHAAASESLYFLKKDLTTRISLTFGLVSKKERVLIFISLSPSAYILFYDFIYTFTFTRAFTGKMK